MASNIVMTDMRIVASTASMLEEPSLKNALKIHVRFIFDLEEPEKL